MEESTRTTVSNLTNNENTSKCTKDSLTSSTTNQSTLRSFSSLTNRTALSIEEIESRRSGFSQFINSLPKICSPTICGTLNYQTPSSRLFSSVCSTKENTKQSQTGTESGYQTSSQNKVEENSTLSNSNKVVKSTSVKDECKQEEFKNPFEEKISKKLDEYSAKSSGEDATNEENNEFDWSIDQIALLNPCDITFDDNFLLYKEFEQFNQSILNKQNEEFFNQNVIAPSPIVNTPIVARKRQIQNSCKTSSPFIDYLNAKKKSMFKTPLHLSSIKSMTSNNAMSAKGSHTCTPINELSVLDKSCLNLPKKKLFHKFESSSLIKSTSRSNESPALSEIGSAHNRFNCTDLDIRRFTLDLSEIGNEFNLSESNHLFKSSTNRKEKLNKLVEEDLLEEDESEIRKLDFNDTNEEIQHDLKDDLEKDLEEDRVKDDELKKGLKDDQINELLDLKNEDEKKTNEDDAHMSISEQPIERAHNNTSLMECSFQDKVAVVNDNVNNVNQLLNLVNAQSDKPQINSVRDEQSNSEMRIAEDDTQMMETSLICSVNNFNGKIDPNSKKFPANQQLTSTPFRF